MTDPRREGGLAHTLRVRSCAAVQSSIKTWRRSSIATRISNIASYNSPTPIAKATIAVNERVTIFERSKPIASLTDTILAPSPINDNVRFHLDRVRGPRNLPRPGSRRARPAPGCEPAPRGARRHPSANHRRWRYWSHGERGLAAFEVYGTQTHKVAVSCFVGLCVYRARGRCSMRDTA